MRPQDAGQRPSFRLAPASSAEVWAGLSEKGHGDARSQRLHHMPFQGGLLRPGPLGDLFACGWSGAGRGGHSGSQRRAFSKPSLGHGVCQAQVCSGHTASQQVHQESQRGGGGGSTAGPRFGAGRRNLRRGGNALWAETQRSSLGSSWPREGAGRGSRTRPVQLPTTTGGRDSSRSLQLVLRRVELASGIDSSHDEGVGSGQLLAHFPGGEAAGSSPRKASGGHGRGASGQRLLVPFAHTPSSFVHCLVARTG